MHLASCANATHASALECLDALRERHRRERRTERQSGRELFIQEGNRAPVRKATHSRTVLGGGNSNAPNDIQKVSAVLDYRVDVLYAQLCFLTDPLNGMTAIQQPDQPTQP